MIARKTLTLILPIFVWFFWTNHCAISDVFALVESSREHAPCHGHGDEGSPAGDAEGQGHHQECEKKGCCQPFLTGKSVDGPLLHVATLNDDQSLFSLFAHSNLFTPSTHPVLPFSLAPPDDWLRLHDLVTSLVTAPNAPPALPLT